MAFNFDSGQFNKESTPKRLGNWQVPRWAPTRARPVEMRPNPKPICDLNGRFLPGAPRGTSKCFGHYTGTWELPRKITRKVAEELTKEPPAGRFSDWLNLRVQRPKAVVSASTRLRAGKRGKAETEKSPDDQTFIPYQCPLHKNKLKKGKKKQ
ncbi:protein Flattop-like isoform X2 [Vanessa cardui]|uniref:protein Flattop-like isoform X2 n=1 Tax=Vanessa cardui TaxID=171605 RepID=UPI001F1387DA|nr:protein Flattop-like isoform X2 [Vanessa cardui]